MGASRFEPFLMESQSRISWLAGDHALAERQVTEAAEAVERLKLQRFIGPWVLGTLALFSSDAAVRKKALLHGAAHLTRDCLAHNAFRFFVSAAEVALLEGDLVTAGFYADQLAGYAAAEPCAWVEHHVALVRAYSQLVGSAGRCAARRTAIAAQPRAAIRVFPGDPAPGQLAGGAVMARQSTMKESLDIPPSSIPRRSRGAVRPGRIETGAPARD